MENDHENEEMLGTGDDAQRKYRHVGCARNLVSECNMNSEKPSRRTGPMLYRIFKLDWVFGALLIISGITLIFENFDPEPMITVDPMVKIAILAGLTLFVALVVTYFSALDRRHAEDYFFQLMSSGAIVGIVTTMFVHIIWDFIYGPLRGDDLMAIMMAGWSMGYFFYRIRGLNP
ncbi:MAG: hypothetical protein AB8B54_06700 [Sphingorhabdus sp.]